MKVVPIGKNRIINGDMRIQQRATLVLAAGAFGYGPCDRWRGANNAASGSITLWAGSLANLNGVMQPYAQASSSAATPASLPAAASIQPFVTTLEGMDVYDLIGKPVTVSFLVRGSIPGRYAASLRDSSNSYSCVKTFDLAAAGTTQFVTLTFAAIPFAAAISPTTGAGLTLGIGAVGGANSQTPTKDAWVAGSYITTSDAINWTSNSSGPFLNISDVKLEEGDTATAFERMFMSQSLAACQRYYNATYVSGRFYATAANQYFDTAVSFPPMRVSPTMTITAAGSGQNFSSRSITPSDNQTARFEIVSNAAGDTYSLNTPISMSAEF